MFLNKMRWNFFKQKKGLTVQEIVVSIIIGVVVLVIAGLIYFALTGKMGFFVEQMRNWMRFGG
jgi:Tfp pilus assembly protein PilW